MQNSAGATVCSEEGTRSGETGGSGAEGRRQSEGWPKEPGVLCAAVCTTGSGVVCVVSRELSIRWKREKEKKHGEINEQTMINPERGTCTWIYELTQLTPLIEIIELHRTGRTHGFFCCPNVAG